MKPFTSRIKKCDIFHTTCSNVYEIVRGCLLKHQQSLRLSDSGIKLSVPWFGLRAKVSVNNDDRPSIIIPIVIEIL